MRRKRDDDREVTRRSLIKWSLAAGAALGVSRSRIAEVLERAGGRGIAEAATDVTTKRSVHVRAGTGGLSWFQLLWPQNDIAAAANPLFAWHLIGAHQTVNGTDRLLTRGAHTPFENLPPDRQITALMAGDVNEAHTNNPDTIVRSVDGASMFAIAAALQSTNPSVIPAIAIGDVDFGTAPGAPGAERVQLGDDIVGLFNSAASRAGGLLEQSRHADLYEAHYAAIAGLNRAANRSTTRTSYATGRNAARFLGTNLAAELAITQADLDLYGIDATMRPEVAEIGRTLIVAAKAFAHGLTNSVVVPGVRDDPHEAFNMPALRDNTALGLRRIFDGFLADLATKIDDITGRPLSDDIVITIEGDTPKTPLQADGWPDNTPGNSNLVYVFGSGHLKTGWFGGIDRNGTVTGFDPATGDPTANYDGELQAEAAVTAVAYALTGDIRRVQDISRLDITGLIRSP
jgi:hypothetical protein